MKGEDKEKGWSLGGGKEKGMKTRRRDKRKGRKVAEKRRSEGGRKGMAKGKKEDDKEK